MNENKKLTKEYQRKQPAAVGGSCVVRKGMCIWKIIFQTSAIKLLSFDVYPTPTPTLRWKRPVTIIEAIDKDPQVYYKKNNPGNQED